MMRKTLLTVGVATLITAGVVYGVGLLAPSSNQTSYFNYSYIDTNNSTTSLKTTSGILYALTIDTPATSSVLTLYDSTSTSAAGTVIAKVTLPATLLQQGPYTAIFDVYFKNGLVIQQTGNTSTLTVSFY